MLGTQVRAVVLCSECGIPRLIFNKLKEKATKKMLDLLDSYCEEAIFSCGDALFPNDVEGSDAKLANIFYNREALSCRDPVEKDYFNYGGLRGRSEFEHVCALCGKSPEESVFVEKEKLSNFQTQGKVALPMCMCCFEKGEKPELAKRSDKVTEELGRKENKKEQKVVATKEKAKREQEQSKSSKGAKAKVPKAEEPIKVLTLPHTTTHYRTLPHTTAHYRTLPHTAAHCHITAVHCHTLPHATAHCRTLPHTAAHYSTLQHTAAHYQSRCQSRCRRRRVERSPPIKGS